MKKMIEEIQKGNKELLNQLVTDSMEFIKLQTECYKGIYEDYEDLVEEAVLAFIKSVYIYKHNPRYNRYFYRQYAGYWISLSLLSYVLKNLDRVYDDDEKLIISLKAYNRYIYNLKHEPTVKEFCTYYNLKYYQAEKIINFINGSDYNNIVLLGLKEKRDDYSLEDEAIRNLDRELFVKKFFDNTLKDNQKRVILYKYGFDNEAIGYTEIGKKEGVSKQCINVRHDYALKKLTKTHCEELKKCYKEY